MSSAAMVAVDELRLPQPLRAIAQVYADEADNDGRGLPLDWRRLTLAHVAERSGFDPQLVRGAIRALLARGVLREPHRDELEHDPERGEL